MFRAVVSALGIYACVGMHTGGSPASPPDPDLRGLRDTARDIAQLVLGNESSVLKEIFDASDVKHGVRAIIKGVWEKVYTYPAWLNSDFPTVTIRFFNTMGSEKSGVKAPWLNSPLDHYKMKTGLVLTLYVPIKKIAPEDSFGYPEFGYPDFLNTGICVGVQNSFGLRSWYEQVRLSHWAGRTQGVVFFVAYCGSVPKQHELTVDTSTRVGYDFGATISWLPGVVYGIDPPKFRFSWSSTATDIMNSKGEEWTVQAMADRMTEKFMGSLGSTLGFGTFLSYSPAELGDDSEGEVEGVETGGVDGGFAALQVPLRKNSVKGNIVALGWGNFVNFWRDFMPVIGAPSWDETTYTGFDWCSDLKTLPEAIGLRE